MNDGDFLTDVAEHLSALPSVEAVALGGSRAQGTNRPESDWDFAVYYRGDFNPQKLRDVGWPGEVFEIGGWGGGVFNGGAWLEVDGRRVDVHYRDLNSVDLEIAEAEAGRFRIEQLMFHLAGIPSYLVVAELALGRTLEGDLPQLTYPLALRESAPKVWWQRADRLFGYARSAYATGEQSAQCIGMVVQAGCCAAHAMLAARCEWITNEKSLLLRADLLELNEIVTAAEPSVATLENTVNRVRELCLATLAKNENPL
jgi:hypothetical protein